jgi:outer membrane protein
MAIHWRFKMRPTVNLARSVFLGALFFTASGAAQEPTTLPGNGSGESASLLRRLIGTYRPQQTGPAQLSNTQDLTQMIQSGTIRLSMAQLRKAVRDNNLDITSASYNKFFGETDVLRARSGGAPRGAPGVEIPSALFAGALGAGVGDTGGLGGFGSAGGISGGARAVTVRPRGTFDPALLMNFSVDRTTAPLNTIQVSGIPTVTTATTALQARYSQAFTTGTSFSVSFNNQRQSSTQRFLLYNPNIVSSFSFSFTQQILNGFGRAVNRRFLDVAENGRKITHEAYRQQVITTLAQAQSLYWDLAAARDNVRVAEKFLEVAHQLYQDNKVREEVGRLSYLDVVTTEAEAAARQRDLVIAQANRQMREVELKNMLSRQIDAELGRADIDTADPLPEPKDADIPKLGDAMSTALQNRPELRQAEGNILNQSIAIKFAKNNLKPTLILFGLFSTAGLYGDRTIQDPLTGANIILPGGIGQAWRYAFTGAYPEYAVGFSFSISLRNRSAQADNVRARLEQRQAETGLEQTRSRIAFEVRKAVIGLVQAKAQTEAARKASDLSGQLAAAEEEKLSSGVSTPYDVIRRQRDLLAAQFAEVQAKANYAKALVEVRRSMGVLDSD